MDNKLKIGFTLGDVNGIGPEVLIKALDDNRILKLCTPVIYGSNRILSFYKKMFNIEGFNYTTCVDADQSNTKSVNIINCITDDIILQPGQDTAIGGKTALISLEAATQDLLAKKIDALVTAPINKNNMQQSGFNYHGHTEYFNAKAGDKESVMLLMNENLRVGLVTNHLAIKEIPAAITKEKILQKIELINHSLKQDFAIFNPTIAVLALNPHSGDGGLLGDEEKNIIIPAIKAAQDRKIYVVGPFAADGFFGSGNYQKFDAILAMYHDQGLVGFKSLSFGSGINFTAGLPFVRTSPDHGTAYDIAGKNEASGESMLHAIFAAIDICNRRVSYAESTKNPLKRSYVEAER
ncbi:MAG: 4-hydroxythreonine-4-phosphate dehydrogenase PdxA [Chitinophagales bacterium]|nr:4-hydroxythreonine-4-phosphate dehydrogenase PdxA [Chitinophagales bacterium]MBP9797457.1 4-hydroxythreonine-4-phosphate dehydrogenase PdxA [Chitinophagales bacterium]